MYLSTGGEIGIPGGWCFFCGEPGGGSNESREFGGFRGLTSDFASSTEAEAETLLNDPYAIQKSEDQLTFEHPDIRTAFASMLKRLAQVAGRLLADDLVPTLARLDPEGSGIKGLINGFAELNGECRWRIDFAPEKGLHFNWEDYTLGKRHTGYGRYGVEKFPGTYDDYLTLLLLLDEGGIGAMLGS